MTDANSQDTRTPLHNAGWPPVAKRLIVEISELFTAYAAISSDVVDSDFSKLLTIAQQLEELYLAYQSGYQYTEGKLWHDIRNIIGTVQGYCELIQEDLSTDNPLLEQLKAVYSLSEQLLLLGDTDPPPSRFTRTSNVQVVQGTILIVDDQRESREILQRHLVRDKHTVLQAASGKEMLTILEQEKVDLILLDLILPEMDGHELLARLKDNEHWRAIPVIVVSGNKDTERVIRCIEAGAEDYLFKPFNPVLLQARINAGVERKRWHDREQQYRDELEKNQRFIRNVFGRYLSEEIVDTLLENPDGLDLGGVQRKVTVLMADIRGFTSIAERLPPQRVVKLLNHYLGAMTEIIMRYNGTVDEFIGDAILAIFGAPISRPDDTDRAIECALAMQAAMAKINVINRADYLPEIEMGISLNTGHVVAGNIGSEKRAKYGVVGHTVNQTARIEELCAAGKILISEATLNNSQSLLSIGESKTIQAKGILKAFDIFELAAIQPGKPS